MVIFSKQQRIYLTTIRTKGELKMLKTLFGFGRKKTKNFMTIVDYLKEGNRGNLNKVA